MSEGRLKLEDQFRIVSLNGYVPEEIYSLKRLPDPKLMVIVQSLDGNEPTRIHQERLIPVECCGKTIIVNKAYKTVCPKCRRLANITSDSFVDCNCSGQRFSVQPANEATRPSFSNAKEDIIMATQAPVEIDIEFVASHGCELWVKDLKFDHPTIPTIGYVLLADSPPRKLPFQTYNGTLGKKATDLSRLCLGEFKSNSPNGTGKVPGYVVRGTLDDERQKLTGLGYEKWDAAKHSAASNRSNENAGVIETA